MAILILFTIFFNLISAQQGAQESDNVPSLCVFTRDSVQGKIVTYKIFYANKKMFFNYLDTLKRMKKTKVGLSFRGPTTEDRMAFVYTFKSDCLIENAYPIDVVLSFRLENIKNTYNDRLVSDDTETLSLHFTSLDAFFDTSALVFKKGHNEITCSNPFYRGITAGILLAPSL